MNNSNEVPKGLNCVHHSLRKRNVTTEAAADIFLNNRALGYESLPDGSIPVMESLLIGHFSRLSPGQHAVYTLLNNREAISASLLLLGDFLFSAPIII